MQRNSGEGGPPGRPLGGSPGAQDDVPGGSDVRLFWAVLVAVLALDVATKRVAEDSLVPRGMPHEVWGDAVRLTLVYNPGAAFGLHLGPFSRWIFTALTLGALVILWKLFRTTRAGDTWRTLALSLVCGGAVGNLLDRLRSPEGVVDFIDVGIGDHRWPTFNVADMAVSVGAFLLAWVLWGEDEAQAEGVMAAHAASATPVAPMVAVAPVEPATPAPATGLPPEAPDDAPPPARAVGGEPGEPV